MATALKVNGVYGIVVGILLLIPSWAAAVFGYPVKDSAVTSGWGTTLIIVGLLSYVAADAARYSGLARIFAGGLLLTAVDLLYYWLIGAYSASQRGGACCDQRRPGRLDLDQPRQGDVGGGVSCPLQHVPSLRGRR